MSGEQQGAAVSAIQPEPSLREQVVAWLRNALFVGDFPPGSTFSVPALAQQFGVSATPVREAVLDLVQQGLVVPVPSKGFLVVDPSQEIISGIMEVRSLLEIPTTCRIAQTLTPEEALPLRKMADVVLEHAMNHDLRGFVEVDYSFHRGVTTLCGNPMLTDLIEDLRSRTRIHTVRYLAARELLIESARHHHQLLDAMLSRDIREVTRVTERHMGYAVAGERWAHPAEPSKQHSSAQAP